VLVPQCAAAILSDVSVWNWYCAGLNEVVITVLLLLLLLLKIHAFWSLLSANKCT